MSPLRRTLTTVTGLLATLTAMALLASAAYAQVSPTDHTYARSNPDSRTGHRWFPAVGLVLTVVAASALILTGAAHNARLHHAQPQPAHV